MNNLVLKNFRAILAGFLLVVILSILTDFVLEKANLMKQPFDQNPSWLIIFVVLHRSLFAIIRCISYSKISAPAAYAACNGGWCNWIYNKPGRSNYNVEYASEMVPGVACPDNLALCLVRR